MEQREIFNQDSQVTKPTEEDTNPWLGPKSPRMGHKAYINSEAWKRKAAKARILAGYRCEWCDKHHPHLEVHHSTYDNLYRERWNDVEVLCPTCHNEADRLREFWTGYRTWMKKKYGEDYQRFDTLARRMEFQEWIDKKLDDDLFT